MGNYTFEINKITIQDLLCTFAMITLIFASGGNHYIRSIFFFLGACALLIFFNKKLKPEFIIVFFVVTGYILINSLLLNVSPTDKKECLVYVIRLAGCTILASSLSFKSFKRIYLKIIIVLSVLSLVCFALMILHIPLPGAEIKEGIWGTFYHTIALATPYNMARKRNSGIFTEPGIFQIYLNIALMVLWSDREMPLKRVKEIFYFLSFVMLTTFSAMGFLIYALVFLLYYTDRREVLPSKVFMKRKNRLILLAICILLGILEEFTMGIFIEKIQNVNSWASRHDDTVLTFLLAKDYPLIGTGLVTNPKPLWDVYYEKYKHLRLYTAYQDARSNGLGNMLAGAGIPFTVIYLLCVFNSYWKMLDAKEIAPKVIIMCIFLLCFMEEPIMPTPFFLLSFFMCFFSIDEKCFD